jgi:hypothetical protein
MSRDTNPLGISSYTEAITFLYNLTDTLQSDNISSSHVNYFHGVQPIVFKSE